MGKDLEIYYSNKEEANVDNFREQKWSGRGPWENMDIAFPYSRHFRCYFDDIYTWDTIDDACEFQQSEDCKYLIQFIKASIYLYFEDVPDKDIKFFVRYC